MDRLESLSNTISQITLYDIKSMYTQVWTCVSRLHNFSYFLLPGQEHGPQCQRDGGQGSRCDQR